MGQKTDLELVEDFKRGDVAGFNELVRRYQERVYWTARRMIGRHEDADDIVQETFIRVHAGLKNFRGESGFYTWLYRITTNLSLNAIRKKRIKDFLPFDEGLEESIAGDEQTDAPLEQAEFQGILDAAIARLPAKQKLVFVMRYHDDLTYEEMAKVLKKSEGGLKANYFHAVKKIQEYVSREMK